MRGIDAFVVFCTITYANSLCAAVAHAGGVVVVGKGKPDATLEVVGWYGLGVEAVVAVCVALYSCGVLEVEGVAGVVGRPSTRGRLAAVGPFPFMSAQDRPRDADCLVHLSCELFFGSLSAAVHRMHLRIPPTVRTGLLSLPRATFPPVELKNAALKQADGLKLTPDVWGSLQVPSPSALAALAARLAFSPSDTFSSSTLKSLSSSTELLKQALTHPSSLSLFAKHYPNAPLPPTNQALSAVGNGLLGLFASEWVHVTYPHLPNRVVKAAVSAYVGPRTLADVAKEWGTAPLLRWSQVSLESHAFVPFLTFPVD